MMKPKNLDVCRCGTRTAAGALLAAFVVASALPPRQALAESVLQGVQVFSDGIQISLDNPARHATFLLHDPPRLVVDLFDTVHDAAPRLWEGRGAPFRAVRSGQFETDPVPVTRIVLDLSAEARYWTYWLGSEMSLRLVPDVPGDLKDALGPLSGPASESSPARRALGILSPLPPVPARVASLRGVEVGADQVRLKLDRPVPYSAFVAKDPPRLVVDLMKTEHAALDRSRPGDGDFLKGVRSGQFESEPVPITRVVFDLVEPVRYSASWEDGEMTVRFAPGVVEHVLGGDPEGRTRRFRGMLLDADGKPKSGTYLLSFALAGSETSAPELWSESVYVKAREGIFTAQLGRHRPLPAGLPAAGRGLRVRPPPGTGWQALAR
ncbi:MAG: AMIN domain-containing protein [Elusimicrobiota bacterium]